MYLLYLYLCIKWNEDEFHKPGFHYLLIIFTIGRLPAYHIPISCTYLFDDKMMSQLWTLQLSPVDVWFEYYMKIIKMRYGMLCLLVKADVIV